MLTTDVLGRRRCDRSSNCQHPGCEEEVRRGAGGEAVSAVDEDLKRSERFETG